MAKKDLYTIDKVSEEKYVCSKYDQNLSLDTAYTIERSRGKFTCDCMAGIQGKHTCRHREMVDIFIDASALNRGRLYAFDKGRWDTRSVQGANAYEEDYSGE